MRVYFVLFRLVVNRAVFYAILIGEQIGEHKNERTHAAKTDNKRRSFGTIRTVIKRGTQYLEASYPIPAYALAKNPQLPKRYTKTVEKQFVVELEVWPAEAQKQIKLNVWQSPAKLKSNRSQSHDVRRPGRHVYA